MQPSSPPSWSPSDPRPQQPQQSPPNPFAGQQQAAPQPQYQPQPVASLAPSNGQPYILPQTVELRTPWPREMMLGPFDLYSPIGRIMATGVLALILPFVLAYLTLTTMVLVLAFNNIIQILAGRI